MIFAIAILPNDYSKFKNKHKSKKVQNEPLAVRMNFTNWLIPGGTIIFVIVIFIRFSGNVSWTLVQPVVPIFLYSLNYTPFQVGLFFSCFGLTMFLGQILLGGLSDKFGRKLILQIGLGIYLLGYLSLFNTTNIINFFLAGSLDGIGLSLIVPSIVALLADLTNNEVHRGKVMGIYYDAFYLAGIVGPPLGGYLGGLLGFNFVLNMSLIIILLAICMSFFIKNLKEEVNPEFIRLNSVI